MEKIVNLVSQKAGISTSQAETAVTAVARFLKDRLPAGMAGKVDAYLKMKEAPGMLQVWLISSGECLERNKMKYPL